MKKNRLGFGFWLLVVSVAVIGVMIWVFVAYEHATTPKEESRTSREVALMCTTDMATQFHIHPVLKIVINGVAQVIPANIGIQPTCMTSIHTHDDSGVIHVESPVKKEFTLGDFFAVWGKVFTKDQILDTKVSAANQVDITVNGEKVETFDQTILKDTDQIVIEVK